MQFRIHNLWNPETQDHWEEFDVEIIFSTLLRVYSDANAETASDQTLFQQVWEGLGSCTYSNIGKLLTIGFDVYSVKFNGKTTEIADISKFSKEEHTECVKRAFIGLKSGHGLPLTYDLAGNPYEAPAGLPKPLKGGKDGNKPSGKRPGSCKCIHCHYLSKLYTDSDHSPTIYCSLTSQTASLDTTALLDSGATRSSYVNPETAGKLVQSGFELEQGSKQRTCSAFNECKASQGTIRADVVIFNELNNKSEKVKITFTVIDMAHDVIIGYPDICTHDLTAKCRSVFIHGDDKVVPTTGVFNNRLNYLNSSGRDCTQGQASDSSNTILERKQCIDPDGTLCGAGARKRSTEWIAEWEKKAVSESSVVEIGPSRDCKPDSNPVYGLSAARALDPEVVQQTEPTHIRDIIDYDIEADDLTKLKEELGSNGHDVPWWELYTSVDPEGQVWHPTEVRSDKERHMNLFLKYEEQFSRTVKQQPANLPPMVLKVEESNWKHARNRLGVRLQSAPKQEKFSGKLKYSLTLTALSHHKRPNGVKSPLHRNLTASGDFVWIINI